MIGIKELHDCCEQYTVMMGFIKQSSMSAGCCASLDRGTWAVAVTMLLLFMVSLLLHVLLMLLLYFFVVACADRQHGAHQHDCEFVQQQCNANSPWSTDALQVLISRSAT